MYRLDDMRLTSDQVQQECQGVEGPARRLSARMYRTYVSRVSGWDRQCPFAGSQLVVSMGCDLRPTRRRRFFPSRSGPLGA